MSNSIIQNAVSKQKAPEEKKTVNQLMNSFLDSEGLRKRFDDLLGERTPQFISSIVSLVNADPNMQMAFYESPLTVIQAGLKAAMFDLPVDQSLGYAYIVPFKNKKKMDDGTYVWKMEATFIPGWKGMNQLALRAGVYKTINVTDVREGELKSFNRLTEEAVIDFIDDEDERDSKNVIGYVGFYKLINGAEKTIYRTIKQLDNHEKKFRKGDREAKLHKDDPDSYYRKTVYRELIGKWGIMSIAYQNQKDAQRLADIMTEEAGSDHIVVDAETGEVINDGEPERTDS